MAMLTLGLEKSNSLAISMERTSVPRWLSIAMKNLRENGYIEMDDNGHITLLPPGEEIAQRMYERHTFLSRWLTGLGVDPKTAVEDACRIEHVISAESFDALKRACATHTELDFDANRE